LVAGPDAVLLFDGVFLLRTELNDGWDFRIFVQASFDVTVARAVSRDAHSFGTAADIRERYLKRYVPGQRLYLSEVRPETLADVVVWDDDPANARR
jgi:uridine kinase